MTIFQMPTIPDDVKTLWDKDGRKWERDESTTSWEWWVRKGECPKETGNLLYDFSPLSTEPPGNVYRIEDMIPDSLVPGMILRDRLGDKWKVMEDRKEVYRVSDIGTHQRLGAIYTFFYVLDTAGPLTEVKE